MEKIAIVTGATGGMGQEIVRDLSRDHHVYALGRSEEKLAELASESVTVIAADLVEELCDGSITALKQLLGLERVDVLVHAAAIANRYAIADAPAQEFRAQFDLNVTAGSALVSHVLPALRKASGLVVMINSGAGKGPHPGNAVYAATKHALYAVTDALRKEEAGNGVRVTTVAPGPTDTEMLRGLIPESDYTVEHYIEPVEVAKAIRLAVDAGPTTQITDIAVRPRVELADR